MTSDIKVNLNITLPGRTMLSEKECSKSPKESYYYSRISYETLVGRGKVVRKTEHLQLRKAVPAIKSLNLSKEAYINMTESYIPKEIERKKWKSMSHKSRLEANLKELVEDMGGISFSYVIFDD